MTNKEYLIKLLSGLNISPYDIEILMLKEGLEPDSEAEAQECDMAVYNRIGIVLKSCMQNVSEGGYSVSWNMEAVKMFYTALCEELRKPNILFSSPKIKNYSNVW